MGSPLSMATVTGQACVDVDPSVVRDSEQPAGQPAPRVEGGQVAERLDERLWARSSASAASPVRRMSRLMIGR
jgi:hypothetical protein